MPDWAKALFPKAISWSDSNFPSIVEEQRRGGLERRIRFGRGGQSCKTAAAVLSKVVELSPDTFGRIYTTQLEKRHPATVAAFMADDTKTAALASWSTHARTVYKDAEAKTVVVYDPWKQRVVIESQQWLTSAAKATGFSVVFQAREKDQGAEGSCQLQATMRVLMAAVHGKGAITDKIDTTEENRHLLIFPVITQLLYTKCRKRRR